tara:strand:- start:19 stop:447 length:429 start_codon:yes stop_codon:yes gene_type:complete
VAFDVFGFKKTGSLGLGSTWSYVSDDDITVIVAQDYFADIYAATIVGDSISLPNQGSNVLLKVTQVSEDSVYVGLALQSTLNNPSFSYSNGLLTVVTYGNGATKTLAYLGGALSSVTLVDGSVSSTKTFSYTDGVLTSITET